MTSVIKKAEKVLFIHTISAFPLSGDNYGLYKRPPQRFVGFFLIVLHHIF